MRIRRTDRTPDVRQILQGLQYAVCTERLDRLCTVAIAYESDRHAGSSRGLHVGLTIADIQRLVGQCLEGFEYGKQ